ncbi:MAG TPA: hypothetical protein VL947_06805, partial [Cytophagales bacterium]|nr:hypothetical protein [Cytophagales bacterium]
VRIIQTCAQSKIIIKVVIVDHANMISNFIWLFDVHIRGTRIEARGPAQQQATLDSKIVFPLSKSVQTAQKQNYYSNLHINL